jgi:hypothetical protein
MPILTDADLRDPSPPVPGDQERAAVAARARQLGNRRRMMQGAGALGMVAAVVVGVAALTAGGTAGPGRHIQAANSAGTHDAANAPTVTAVTAPSLPTENNTATGAVEPPSTFTVSGTVANVPAGVTVTLTLTGSGGTFTAVTDAAGSFSVSGIPPGDYNASYEWVDSSGTATQAGRFGSVTVTGDSTVSFALP